MPKDNNTLQTTSGQHYLDKDFSTELNYKLWTTKGARFSASHRLKKLNKLSSYSIGFLSAYLIILGLLSVIDIKTAVVITSDQYAFISTSLSVIILVFSQLESANDYRLKAEKYHDCALEVSELYNKLRYLKTSNKTKEEVNQVAEGLAHEYSVLLRKYENHESVDFEMFKTTKPEYFKLKKINIIFINLQYYIKTMLLYHFLIIAPPIIIYFILK